MVGHEDVYVVAHAGDEVDVRAVASEPVSVVSSWVDGRRQPVPE